MARIVIDPFTRIEGHLRIEAQIDSTTGKVTDAWSAGTMFRGLEMILKGRDPREAWVFTQRICGVCTTVHAIASCRAVENALGITIPVNAQILRNLLEAALYVHDHVVHFYHLHALDWVDVTAALKADPTATSNLQKSISPWANNTAAYFTTVKSRLQKLVNSGQLGIFANGYWGHPGYKLPAEANLLLVAHYLEALNFQRDFVRFHAILGGKNPHPQTYAVGGMAIPLDKSASSSLNPTKIATLKQFAQTASNFVNQVYIPDVKLAAKYYGEWASLGCGVTNFLSFGDFPQDAAGNSRWLPRGLVQNKALTTAPAAVDQARIAEYVAHSWFNYTGGDSVGLHPSQGQTTPNYTGPTPPYTNLNTAGKYSWLKTPRYNNLPVEVGPLARMVVAYAAGQSEVRTAVNNFLSSMSLPSSALFSTLGRIAARAIETQVVAAKIGPWLDQLLANINAGNTTAATTTKWSPSTWPSSATGWGGTEAPRGALGHWVSIANGKISAYQLIVATQWNASPRDAAGTRGAFEAALIGTPVADPNRPVEILRTIHSFDPCMACSVHVIDRNRKPIAVVEKSLAHV